MTPLYVDRVSRALQEKQDRFQRSQEDIARVLKKLHKDMDGFRATSRADLEARLQEIEEQEQEGSARFGARPTQEQDEQPFIIPFRQGRGWPHHRLAREWASAVLNNVTTFAADGSVIDPSGDMSISVGLVQIGWFQNPHNPARPYVKDVRVDLVLPEDMEGETPSAELGWRRYQGETEQAIAFMQAHAGQRALAFLDGTLTISFVRKMPPERQAQFRDCVKELMKVSEETRVPAVGYVDSSDSIDLMTLLLSFSARRRYGYDAVRAFRVSDPLLLHSLKPYMQWGDRSRTFICDRDDGVPGNDYYSRVCFTYLQTTQRNPPARLEIPRWVFEDPALYAWVLDVVRAECIVGVGYPYPLETADAVAVLSGQDRERFHRLFQEFAAQNEIAVRFSRKSTSKRGRRM